MRRRFVRIFRRRPGGENQPLARLQHANRLMAAEDYRGAASAFEDLGRQAANRGGPHAAFFFLQAGRARLILGEYPKSITNFKNGLTLLSAAERYTQFYHVGMSIIQELKARKLEKEAHEISDLVHGNTVAIAEMATQQHPHDEALLPMHCPSCGGPLRSDEIDWVDEVTAECPFCGSPARVE